MNATTCFSPFKSSPSNVPFPVDSEQFDNRTSSPSSVRSDATVKIYNSPRPSTETDSRCGEDFRVLTHFCPGSVPASCSDGPEIIPHRSIDTGSRTSLPATLRMDPRARANLQWKSLAHFHQSSRQQSPRVLSQLPNSENAPRHLHHSYDTLVPTDYSSRGGQPFETGPYQWDELPKTTAHPRLSPLEVRQSSGREENTYFVTKDRSLCDVPAIETATLDCTVKMSTVATVAGNGKLHVHHLALLSVIMPMEAIHAEKTSLSFIISNALRTDHKCSLELGQSSVLFKEDVSKPGLFPREGAELVVVRDSRDLVKPLNLYFNFTYSSPWHSVTVSLPTVRPRKGRSLSEVVFIAEPQPPLSMETFVRDPLSSWRLYQHPVSQVTCYERIHLPEPYPARFQDDIQTKFSELSPVRFRALGESTFSSVVWKLDIAIHKILREQMECRMSFFVEVGAATAFVTLISHGWVPRYFIIDGCVATEKAGECWKDKEGYITIFKQAHMGPGPIMVETYWQGSPKHGNHDVGSTHSLHLPRVANHKVLGGKLTCQAADSKLRWERPGTIMLTNMRTVIILNHLEERLHPYGSVDGTSTLLPTMDPGYKILLKRVIETRSQDFRRHDILHRPSLTIPEDTHLSRPVASSEAEVRNYYGTLSSHTIHNASGTAAPPQHPLKSLLLALLILLLLVPCLLLFVEHVRKGNDYNERTHWMEPDRDLSSWDGEKSKVDIDEVGFEPLHSAVAAADSPVEVTKCEGWRDWIDYGSGWKGCVP